MTALILIDQAHRHDQGVSQAATFLMNDNRVRFVDVLNLADTDFTDVNYLVLACNKQTFGDSVNAAINRSTARGMKTLSLLDVERMRNFHTGHIN